VVTPEASGRLPAGQLSKTLFESPIGPLVLVADDWGLRSVTFPDGDRPAAVTDEGQEVVDDETLAHPVLRAAVEQLVEYFEGRRRTFDLALNPVGTDFQRRAWNVLTDIPYGTTISYREQATLMGSPGATQAVGSANGANPLPIVVPCHRVVGSDGSLIGFGGGIDLKRQLLDREQGTLRLF
jgi:methylated-DNA-[protein]-cysteine S-methyltransferase